MNFTNKILIPNFVLILILIVAWKHEWIGTIAFTWMKRKKINQKPKMNNSTGE